MDIKNIIEQGYFIKDIEKDHSNLAKLSLMESLKLFFKTADDIHLSATRILDEECNIKLEEKRKDYGLNYAVDACYSLIHLQHFIELYIKGVLGNIDKLLVYDLSKNPLLYYKALENRENVLDEELENVYFIEFAEAKKRLENLIKNKVISNYDFLLNHSSTMDEINRLRNRIAHRGVFVLDYNALDELYGNYVFRFVKDIAHNDSNYNDIFQYCMTLNNNKIKPFEDIISEYSNQPPNKYKIYVLKMIGYSAYNNSIPSNLPQDQSNNNSLFDYKPNEFYNKWLQERRDKASKIAESIVNINDGGYLKISECPVCKCKTLIEAEDTAEDDKDIPYSYVYNIECSQCGFKLSGIDFLNGNYNGLKNVINYM